LKKSNLIVPIVFLLMCPGCGTHSTVCLTSIEIKDFEFSVVENSPATTYIGTVSSEGIISEEARYFLVANEYSHSFELDPVSGALKVREQEVLDYETIQTIKLEVLAMEPSGKHNYGIFANITIQLRDTLEIQTWTSDEQSPLNRSTIINSLYSDSVMGFQPVLLASAWTVNLQPMICRSLFRFDLSTMPSEVKIASASLSLYHPNDTLPGHLHSTFSGPNRFLVSRLTQDWDANQVTWNKQPQYTIINQAVVPETHEPDQDYLSIDLTDILKDMADNPNNNFGFMLGLENEKYYRRVCFASFHHFDKGKKPKLEIKYYQ
jgi:hypothetical protein